MVAAMPVWAGIELPGFDAALVDVPAVRREALAAHLRDVLADVGRPEPEPEPAPQRAPGWSADACATCRGHCCSNGADGAFLDMASLVFAWKRLADLSREQLVMRYMRAVPAQSFAGSCIFHSVSGCSLPRAMRPRICVDYLCLSLRSVVDPPGAAAGNG